MIEITVAICTWNRAAHLRTTLEQLTQLQIPNDIKWELLIVNNRCTDNTEQVLDAYESRLPIRRLYESKPGQSHARNCALREFAGELLVWTDDDVKPDPSWLMEYMRAMRTWPEAAYFGGRIVPWFDGQPPSWLIEHQDRLQGMLVVRNLGSEERPFREDESPFGANMAFRRSAIEGLRFNPDLGRIGDGQITGDETDYIRRLKHSGQYGVWVPNAVVEHWVSRQRMTPGYLNAYYRGTGRTMVRMNEATAAETVPRWWGVPRWLVRKALEARFKANWQRLIRHRDWPRTAAHAATLWGMMEEHRQHAARRDDR